ncbi:MAG: TIGR03503 family protein [Vibrio sp.]
MLRILALIVGCWISFSGFASQSSSLSLLDNRFRVDPSISQITFVIYRENNSQPVVLVRPDGRKYYQSRNPDYVRWYQEPSMDIISIDNPMPGPWQAIGKVTPKNHIKLISDLQLTSDVLPSRVFQGEQLKFSARLTSNGQPLLLRDFLDRVNLKVTFTKYIDNEESLAKEARPIPVVIGEFADDGQLLDEKPGDGVFTVALMMAVEPGKYRVRITSGNGVFLRAQEQQVLVYPNPILTTFIQSRVSGMPHQVMLTGEQGMIEPGSLLAHIVHRHPYQADYLVQAQAEKSALTTKVTIPYQGELGHYAWHGQVWATELASQRELYFPIADQTYSVVDELNLAEVRRIQQQEEALRLQQEQELRMLQMREAQRSRTIIYIMLGNLVVLVLALIGWFVLRKIKREKVQQPPMQLNMPNKNSK